MSPATDSRVFAWRWNGAAVPIGYDLRGDGPPVLLLPAFSTVSTREEMAGLAGQLARSCKVVSVDWPGFGRGSGPALRHTSGLHAAFLSDFADQVLGAPAAVVAAGHAAGYALLVARQRPGVWSRIALVAPTWCGPLPTMMQGYRPLQGRIAAALRAPVIGHTLYRFNVSTPVVAMMLRRHVYSDPSCVTPALLADKAGVARRRAGRFGSGAFVTGELDVVRDRQSFAELASPPTAPTLVLYGPNTPARSLAEMEALAALPGIRALRFARGSLGMMEEFPAELGRSLMPFLSS